MDVDKISSTLMSYFENSFQSTTYVLNKFIYSVQSFDLKFRTNVWQKNSHYQHFLCVIIMFVFRQRAMKKSCECYLLGLILTTTIEQQKGIHSLSNLVTWRNVINKLLKEIKKKKEKRKRKINSSNDKNPTTITKKKISIFVHILLSKYLYMFYLRA